MNEWMRIDRDVEGPWRERACEQMPEDPGDTEEIEREKEKQGKTEQAKAEQKAEQEDVDSEGRAH